MIDFAEGLIKRLIACGFMQTKEQSVFYKQLSGRAAVTVSLYTVNEENKYGFFDSLKRLFFDASSKEYTKFICNEIIVLSEGDVIAEEEINNLCSEMKKNGIVGDVYFVDTASKTIKKTPGKSMSREVDKALNAQLEGNEIKPFIPYARKNSKPVWVFVLAAVCTALFILGELSSLNGGMNAA